MLEATAPLSPHMGFRPDLSLDDFLCQTRLDVVERAPVNAFGYWTLIGARYRKPASTHAARA